MKSQNPCSLAILCGGYSTRLGTDKGLYRYLGDETLVERAVRLWSPGFAEVLIVTRDPEQAALYREVLEPALSRQLQLRIVCDSDWQRAPSGAALSGVLTALLASRQARILALPVDQLGVRGLHLERLLGVQSAFAAYATDEDGGPGPLPFPSLWPAAAADQLGVLMAGGGYGVRTALAEFNAELLTAYEYLDELNINGNTASDFRDYFGEALRDPMGRRLHYLRFSLTEACNMSCTYCLPDGYPEWYRHRARLGIDEVRTLLTGFRRLGFRKLRLTGGEPTVHPGCLDTVRLARRLGYEQIAVTTNATLIKDLSAWRAAGLTHINISLDSLDPEVFARLTRSKQLAKVLDTVEGAIALGLDVKINTVLMNSHNADRTSVEKLIDWALARPLSLRFIELMETGLNGDFAKRERVLGSTIVPWLQERGLAPLHDTGGGGGRGPVLAGPATEYGAASYLGRIGFINPMSCNFCDKCNRLRITAKGRLKLCLFGDQDHALDLTSSEAVALNVRQLIDRKPERHYLEEGRIGNVATFRTIGG